MEKFAFEMAMDISRERDAALTKIAAKAPGVFDSGGLADQFTRGAKATGAAAVGLFAGGYLIKTLIDKINNDATRKQLLENVILNDPALKGVDKKTLLEWYATMVHYAPTLSLDKATVKEVLHTFAQFGKVDMQTLNTLAKTEESIAKSKVSSHSFLSDLIR